MPASLRQGLSWAQDVEGVVTQTWVRLHVVVTPTWVRLHVADTSRKVPGMGTVLARRWLLCAFC